MTETLSPQAEKELMRKMEKIIRQCTDLSGQFPRVDQEEVAKRIDALFQKKPLS